MSQFVPSWVWCVAGGALALALASGALRADVVLTRHARGSRRVDIVAQVVAAVLVGAWLWLLWDLLLSGCFGGTCDPPMLTSFFVIVPIAPLGGLTTIGFLIRRSARAGA